MIVNIKIIPRAAKEKIELFNQGLKVHVNAPAIDNKANLRLIEVLAQYYRVKKYQVKIIKGEKQRNKLIEIEDS
jgi:hypothetical protein